MRLIGLLETEILYQQIYMFLKTGVALLLEEKNYSQTQNSTKYIFYSRQADWWDGQTKTYKGTQSNILRI